MQKKGKKEIKSIQKPFDFTLCITIFLLLALGIIMVLSASAPSALSTWRKQLSLCYKASRVCTIRYYFDVCYIKNRLSYL